MIKKQKMTIDDIAQALGVSKTTISRAISGKGRVSEVTRARVLSYIQTCNYRPSAAAKGLAENRTCNLMLVLPHDFSVNDSSDLRLLMKSVWAEAARRDYNILLCYCDQTPPSALIRALDNRTVDGVILPYMPESDTLSPLLKQRQIPFATISGNHTNAAVLGEAACKQLVHYLLGETYEPVPLPGCQIHI